MTLINRKTIVDRPELVDRDDNENEENNGGSRGIIEQLGDADGPTINGITFEKGDYGVVAASNLVAVLSTAQTEGDEFQQSFMTSAIQMKEMADSGIDISPIARMSRSRGIDDLNISQDDLTDLKLATQAQPVGNNSTSDDVSVTVEEDDTNDEEESNNSSDEDDDDNDAREDDDEQEVEDSEENTSEE